MVDAGADLVVGHHPHVLQGVEFYRSGAIAYSLGNMVFSNPTIKTRRTGVLWVELKPGKPTRLTRLELVPAFIWHKDYTPRPANRKQTEDLLRRMQVYSRHFGTQVVLQRGRLRFLSGREVRPPTLGKP